MKLSLKSVLYGGFKISKANRIEINMNSVIGHHVTLDGRSGIYIRNWDNNYYSRALKEKYKSHKNIILLDAIYDTDVLNLIRSNCTIYVHGHSVGGTNPALVEPCMSEYRY